MRAAHVRYPLPVARWVTLNDSSSNAGTYPAAPGTGHQHLAPGTYPVAPSHMREKEVLGRIGQGSMAEQGRAERALIHLHRWFHMLAQRHMQRRVLVVFIAGLAVLARGTLAILTTGSAAIAEGALLVVIAGRSKKRCLGIRVCRTTSQAGRCGPHWQGPPSAGAACGSGCD